MNKQSGKKSTILVTGGAGFIGSNFIHDWIGKENGKVICLDLLTYSGNPENLAGLEGSPLYEFVKGDIGDRKLVEDVLSTHKPEAVINFAAESHVDRSIVNPEAFVETNVMGTFRFLDECLAYWKALSTKDNFRFLHVSTDEVYGSLGPSDAAFSESNRYEPNSPYSASKASSDHFVRAYHHTYGLPVLTTNCSNNYGPYQFPEKLIPLIIINAISWRPLPIYGDGMNVRDWLYVRDHCDAICQVLEKGMVGETYNVGGNNEIANIDLVKEICRLLNRLKPNENGKYEDLITFVKDRPGHDRRYAIDNTKISNELAWSPSESFESGIQKTIQWYLENESWIENVQSGAYREWLDTNYSNR